jgi:flagellar motor switch protein FliG
MSDVEEVQLNIVRMIRQLDRDGEVKIVLNKNDKFV